MVMALEAHDDLRNAFRPLRGMGWIIALAEGDKIAGVAALNRARGPGALDAKGLNPVAVAMRHMSRIHRAADAEFKSGTSVFMEANCRQQPGFLVGKPVAACDFAQHRPFLRWE